MGTPREPRTLPLSPQRYEPHPWVRGRKLIRPPTVAGQHGTGGNARLALYLTNHVGTMYTAYLFAFIALVGLPQGVQNGPAAFVQWLSSNFIQLVLLPVIIVGQNIQAKASDARADMTYKDAEAVLHECARIQHHLEEQDAVIAHLITVLKLP